MLKDTVSGHTVSPASGATTFTLSQTVPAGSSYDVTVITQPSSPAQSCSVTSGGTGTANNNVTSVVVSCTAAYTIGGTITGTLTGTGLVIKDSVSGNTTTVAAGATTFTITPAVASGSSYNVSVTGQPSSPTEACSVTSGGAGTANANITSVVVHCSISQFTVGGTITGYAGSGLVLKDTVNNHQVTVPVNATTFAITPAINSGATYTVAVLTNPATPTQACTITSGASGTVGAGNVTSVVVSCTTSTFTVGGTISGLTGTGLVLKDSVSGHTVSPAALDGSFTLTPAVNSGTNYNVSVTAQPTGPAQLCSVTGGTGTVTTMNVATISVSCVGGFVFVTNANDGSGSIAALSFDASTGALTWIGGASIGSTHAQPVAVAVDPGGGSLYVADAGAANVDTYTIGANGALTATASSAGTGTGSVPSSLALDGNDLYVGSAVTGTVGAFSISGGALTGLSGSPYPDGNSPYGIAVDPNGFLFAANNTDGTIGCFTIASDGTLGAVSNPTFPGGGAVTEPYALAVAPAGVAPTGGYLYITDTSTTPSTVTAYSYTDCSALTLIGSAISVGTAAKSVAVDPTGSYLYVANSGDATVSGFTITAGTGALTSIGGATATGASASASPAALIVDPSSQYLYVANGDGTISLLTIGAGGALTAVGMPLTIVNTTGGPSGIAIE